MGRPHAGDGPAARPAGSKVVFLDDTLTQLDFAKDALGTDRYLRTGPAHLPLESDAYSVTTLRPRGFGLVVMGKDGRVAQRKPTPWSVREISRAIDKLPLRQQELRDGHDTVTRTP